MFDLEVFDASVLQDLKVQAWSGIDAFAEVLSESTATITSDGHLVLWSKRVNPTQRSKAFDAITSMCAAREPKLLLSGDLLLKVFYRDKLHWGTLRYLEPMSYSTERVPEVFGNLEDQQPGSTTFTIVSNKKTLDFVRDRWKPRILQEGRGAKSALFVATSGAAIQLRLLWDEVSIEDVIDVFVGGAFAVKEQRRSRMLLGLSYTQAVSLPTVKPSFKLIQVNVEEKYGPFEKV